MKKALMLTLCIAIAAALNTDRASAQVSWMVGGRLGLSIYNSGSGAAGYYDPYYGYIAGTSSTSAGLQIGPTAEVIFNRNLAVGSEFNINTQSGTPIEWSNFFKYYFPVPGSPIKPYADGGFSLFFYTGGPYFGIRFGGGALFPVAKNLYIPADLQLGPVFGGGSTVFYLAITTGVRYQIF